MGEVAHPSAARLPAFDNPTVVAFPTGLWVSVQLTQDETKHGGETAGLRPFTGYELDLTPIPWSMADVAERLVGTVTYLFWHGPVLKNGETLGVTEAEKFRIKHEQKQRRLALTLKQIGFEV